MKITLTWANEWLGRTIIDQHLVGALDQAGMEVEQVTYTKPIDKNVVVCSVKKVVQHPTADRLKIVSVSNGNKELSIVCGAPNVRPGIHVPLAQIGAILPGGEVIKSVKLRGELSEGMLCSAAELGLGNDHTGLLELDPSVEAGQPLSAIFPPDTLIDLKSPANRFDVQSIIGLSRDAAAMSDIALRELPKFSRKFDTDDSIIAPKLAAVRFSLVKVTIPQLATTPTWMQARLRMSGMRPISLLVDITNYVMLETGQPLHAYDASEISLPFDVRFAKEAEPFTTLDGKQRILSSNDLVVTDASGVVGLAGVMGGQKTEVKPDTTSFWLEAAVFDSVSIRKTAQRHNLRSEASARFERGLPVELPSLGLARAIELLQDLAGATIEMAVSAGPEHEPDRSIELPFHQLRTAIGFDITPKEAKDCLQRLQFGNLEHQHDGPMGDALALTVPWWRPDVKLPIDVIEEIVRVVGYDRIPARIPEWRPSTAAFDRIRARRRQVRDIMYAAGLFEVMTYSFISKEQLQESGSAEKDHLKLKNPLSVEQAYLRSDMLPSHLTVAERNRTYARQFGFFEMAQVFVKQSANQLPAEPLRLAITLVRSERALKVLKGLLDQLAWELNVPLCTTPSANSRFAPGRVGEISHGQTKLGVIGELHPEIVQSHKITSEVAYLEIDLQPLLDSAVPRQFSGIHRFPVIRRDISVWVPLDLTWDEVAKALSNYSVEYVDEYIGDATPQGTRGLTLRVVVSHDERTPTEAEADEVAANVLDKLQRQLGVLRRD